jgi:hypothetical protein
VGSPARAHRRRRPSHGPAGGWRARRSRSVCGELRVAGLGPGARPAPADPLGPQDAADLAALHLDPERLGGLGEGIQGPVGRRLGRVGVQAPVGGAAQPPRRWLLDQANELAALVLGEPRRAAGTGAVPKPVQPSALNRLLRSRTVWGWQWSSAAIWLVRAPSQLRVIIRARAIQSPGAWRLAASLRTARSSAASWGGRADSRVGTGSPGRRQEATKPTTPIIYSQIEERSTRKRSEP